MSVQADTAYNIADAPAGQDYLDFDTLAHVSNFTVGAEIFILGGEYQPSSTDYYKASHATIVKEIDGNRVYLRDKLPLALVTGDAGSPTARKLSTNLTRINMQGVPAEALLAKGVRFINAAFESAEPELSQVVHMACWDCDLDFRYLKGGALMGANPCVDTRLSLKHGEYGQRAYELAYHHHRVNTTFWRARRFYQSETPRPPFAIGEWGSNSRIGYLDIEDEDWAGDTGNSNLYLLSPGLYIESAQITGSQGAGVAIGVNGSWATGTTINNLRINSPATNGLVVDCPDVTIGNLVIENQPVSTKAVWVKSGASLNTRLIRFGGTGTQYKITDDNNNATPSSYGIVKDTNKLFKPVNKITYTTTAGSYSEVILETYTIPAGTSVTGQQWKFRFFGNVSTASVTGTKTIRFYVGATAVGTVSLSAAQTGAVEIEMIVTRGALVNQIDVSGFVNSVAGTSRFTSLYTATDMSTTDLAITFRANMNVADNLIRREWSVIPLERNFLA